MGINTKQLIELVIRPTLIYLNMNSLAAEQQVVGTFAKESDMGTFIAQNPKGPAKGPGQMEDDTHDSIWDDYLKYRPDLYNKVMALVSSVQTHDMIDSGMIRPHPSYLIWDLRYATAMTRLQYARVKEPLPGINDIAGMARYWKTYYNTSTGAGTEQDFMTAWNKYCAPYYRGK